MKKIFVLSFLLILFVSYCLGDFRCDLRAGPQFSGGIGGETHNYYSFKTNFLIKRNEKKETMLELGYMRHDYGNNKDFYSLILSLKWNKNIGFIDIAYGVKILTENFVFITLEVSKKIYILNNSYLVAEVGADSLLILPVSIFYSIGIGFDFR